MVTIQRSKHQPNFRYMEPVDGEKLSALFDSNPDNGRIAITPRYQLDPYQALLIQHPKMCGILAEVRDRIVGLGLLRFGICRVEGQLHPYAWLNSLIVDSDYRQQGIGTELALRRVALARERVGEDGLLLTSIQSSNRASLAIAQKWTHYHVGELQSVLIKTLTKLPVLKTGITVREASTGELVEVADGLNNYYADFDFYEPHTSELLAHQLQLSLHGQPINRCLVAVNDQQAIVAGLILSEQYRLVAMQVDRLPTVVSVLNKFVKMVPPDRMLRQIAISKIWHLPGCEQEARELWQTVRWQTHQQGSHLTCFFDPKSDIPHIIQTPRWLPKAKFSIMAQGELAKNKANHLYPL